MLTCRNPWLIWRTALSQLSGDLGIFGCRSFCPFWSPSLKKKGDLETSLSPPKKKNEFLVFSTSKWPFCFTRHLLRWNCLNLILIYLDWLLDVFEFEQKNACSGRASLIIRWDMLTFCGKGTYTYIHYESYTVYSICCIYICIYVWYVSKRHSVIVFSDPSKLRLQWNLQPQNGFGESDTDTYWCISFKSASTADRSFTNHIVYSCIQ